ncbi:MAG: ribonuclease P protein component [Bacteroidetes bacterium]|nr:ribonuclease P protein component [Bacteroidota bacterium]
MAIRNTFKTYERLKREQHIDTLFRKGKAFSFAPLRFIYMLTERGAELSPVRAGFSVPKKKFRKSVQRHRITRLMREAWRLNKHSLYNIIPADKQLHIFIICTDNTEPTYESVTATIIKGVEQLKKQYE